MTPPYPPPPVPPWATPEVPPTGRSRMRTVTPSYVVAGVICAVAVIAVLGSIALSALGPRDGASFPVLLALQVALLVLFPIAGAASLLQAAVTVEADAAGVRRLGPGGWDAPWPTVQELRVARCGRHLQVQVTQHAPAQGRIPLLTRTWCAPNAQTAFVSADQGRHLLGLALAHGVRTSAGPA